MTIATYESLLTDEVRASGRLPLVAVMGCNDYDTIIGEIMTLFNVLLEPPDKLPDKTEFKGVCMFKSYAHKHGVWFGGAGAH